MSDSSRAALRFRRAFLLLLVSGISILFLLVVHRFLLAVFLAAVFAGLVYPAFDWILGRLGGRRAPAAGLTVLLLFLGAGLPLAGFLTIVVTEAIQVGQGAQAWFAGQADLLERGRELLERIPLVDRVIPDPELIALQLQEAAGRAGPVVLGSLAAATLGTAQAALQLFILGYALFFFLKDGPTVLDRVLNYLPLDEGEKAQLMGRFVSVTRATLKGSLLIGVIQGGVAGLAFWVAGVPGPAFWGTIMVVLSIIPAVGAALVWIPAVLYLFSVGQVIAAIGLFLWCAIVVGTLDNFLRPRLIGRDAKMSDLMILISTLGGIILFGVLGFIVGPIIAALFVTVWHIYGEAFRDWLPGEPTRT